MQEAITMDPWAIAQLMSMGWTNGPLKEGGLEEPISVIKRPMRLGLGALPPHLDCCLEK